MSKFQLLIENPYSDVREYEDCGCFDTIDECDEYIRNNNLESCDTKIVDVTKLEETL